MSATVAHRIDALLARLDRVRQAGAGKWQARCPAHEDRSPSLSIRDAGERVLLHCFAGCSAEDVLAAVGMTFCDLFPDDPSRAAREAFYGQRRRRLAPLEPLDHERRILLIAAADLRAGRELSIEDRARVALARERVAAHG